MSTIGLSAPARYVLRSLMEQPHLQTADEIAEGPLAPQGIDTATLRGGLAQLADRGLAVEGADGRWSLTDAGHRAYQPG